MTTTVINVGKDFSKYPVGRYLTDGDANGEKFRESFLKDALRRGAVKVVLDDAFGYGSSFLEEAFGGLIRIGFLIADLRKNLTIETNDASLAKEIWQYIEDASRG